MLFLILPVNDEHESFERNTSGNAFWERLGFTVREDLVYRNMTLTEMTRIDT